MEKRLLNIGEASEYLGIKVTTLRSWCSRKDIPYHKINGRMVRFDIHQLDQWLEESLIKPQNSDNILEPGLAKLQISSKRI